MSKIYGLDLACIPQSGPFMNYRNWLDWKLRNLQVGESVRLPIFSAIVIERWQEGFVLRFASEQMKGFTTSERVLAYIEHHIYQPTSSEKRLVQIATIKLLYHTGKTFNEIAKSLNMRLPTVIYHLTRLAAIEAA